MLNLPGFPSLPRLAERREAADELTLDSGSDSKYRKGAWLGEPQDQAGLGSGHWREDIHTTNRTLHGRENVVKKGRKTKMSALVNTADKLSKNRTKKGHQSRPVVLNLHWTLQALSSL